MYGFRRGVGGSGGGGGNVTTLGGTAGQVTLWNGPTSITGDSGCTWTGTGDTFHLKFGASANAGIAWLTTYTLRVSDGSNGYGDIQLNALKARTLASFRFIADASNNTVSLASDTKFQFSSTTGAQGTPDLAISRASAGTLLVEDGSGNARDVQARTGTFGTSVVTSVLTVATLPAVPVAGSRAMVSDALAPAFGAPVAAGGAVTIPVFYDGAAWIVG